MGRRFFERSFASVAMLALIVATAVEGEQTAPRPWVERWRADLRFLAKELPARHKNLYHTISRSDFERAVAQLDSRIPELTDAGVLLELRKLITLVRDGHTRFALTPELGFGRVPIVLFGYSDGLYVIRASAAYGSAVGARVVAIGSGAVQDVMEQVKPFVSSDNAVTEQRLAVALLTVPRLLHALGFAPDPEHLAVLLEDQQGRRFTMDLAVGPALDPAMAVNLWDQSGTTPLRWTGNEKNYWFTYLEPSQTLYMQYNIALDASRPSTFERFCREFFEFADARPIDRFVIDLRNNGGGNGNLHKVLIDGFRSRKVFEQPRRLFVVIGRRTVSAGLMAALDLKHGRFFREKPAHGDARTTTVLVGEPTGGKPNSYSELGQLMLPNSRIVVDYSRLFWELAPELGNAPSLDPDITVAPSVDADRGGRDPVIEAILSH